MRWLLPTLSVASLLFVACAHTDEQRAAAPASARAQIAPSHTAHETTPHATKVAIPAQVASPKPQPSVSLTGEGDYLHRYDASGWSGTSTPAVGGGPPPGNDVKLETPQTQVPSDATMPAEYGEPQAPTTPEATPAPKPDANDANVANPKTDDTNPYEEE